MVQETKTILATHTPKTETKTITEISVFHIRWSRTDNHPYSITDRRQLIVLWRGKNLEFCSSPSLFCLLVHIAVKLCWHQESWWSPFVPSGIAVIIWSSDVNSAEIVNWDHAYCFSTDTVHIFSSKDARVHSVSSSCPSTRPYCEKPVMTRVLLIFDTVTF